jgi:dTDP-glucose pyrophosphorylase
MRKADSRAELSAQQTAAADVGVKAMMPMGRPFLDYSLTAAADAGFRRACLVIGPEHDAVRRYYTRTVQPKRLKVEFAVQESPLGTADAVGAARDFAGDDLFCVVNSDNYYPAEALKALADLNRPGLVAFDAEALVREGNVSPERIAKFAVVQIAPSGRLVRIIEKPDAGQLSQLGSPHYVSMNCWCFSPAIFGACGAIQPSLRGELEVTSAVQYAMDRMGENFAVVRMSLGVLDLSSRSDVAAVTARLAGVEVNL